MSDDRTPGAEHRPAPDDLLNELTPAEWRMVVSLVEAIATSDEADCPVCRRQIDRTALSEHIAHCRDFSSVRTRRLEVVDERGRVLALLGELDRPPAPQTVGLALLDGDGMERAVLAVNFEGPKLDMATVDGNTALELGVDYRSCELDPATYLILSDHSARPVQSWTVTGDGRLQVVSRPPGEEQP